MSAINFATDLVPEASALTPADWARRYTEDHGFVLTWLYPRQKHTLETGWPDRPIQPDHWVKCPQDNMGLLLDNGTRKYCSLDLDDVPMTRLVFASLGLDWEEMTAHSVASQGNPDRFRVLFLAPEGGLRTKQLKWPKQEGEEKAPTIFELRGGHGFQDVLPPSIHPNGQAYAWLPGRAPWETDILPMPAILEDLWRHWADWKGELEALCPWAESPAIPDRPLRGRARGEKTTGVISAWNDAHSVGEILRHHGYVQKNERRWLAPGSSTGLPGVSLLKNGKVYSHHGSDPLNDGQGPKDAFDAFRILEHDGKIAAAVKAAANILRIPRTHPQPGPGETYGADLKARTQDGQAGQVHPQHGAHDTQGSEQEVGQEGTQEAEQDDATAFRPVSLEHLGSIVVDPPSFLIQTILPRGAVSLLGAHGESGKSFLGLVLAAHVACGKNWGGLNVNPGRALFLSMEDDAGILLHRLQNIALECGLDYGALKRNLTVIDASDVPPLAQECTVDGGRTLKITPAGHRFIAMAKGYDLVLIDNASDAFAGNEIARDQVRAFIKQLGKVAKENKGALLLLVHVNREAVKNGAGGQSYSGSTGWHNSARSRLALVIQGESVSLVHEKSNYGPRLEQPIPIMRSPAGVPYPAAQVDLTQAKALTATADDEAVLAAIRAALGADRTIPVATQGAHTAWAAIRIMPDFPAALQAHAGKARVDAAMLRLQGKRLIAIESYRRNSRDYQRWSLG